MHVSHWFTGKYSWGWGMSDSSATGGRERRRHIRVRISVDARIEAPPRAPQPCDIYDMSIGGALMETRVALRLGQHVILHLADFGVIEGRVARVTSTVLAIIFEGVDQAALGVFLSKHEKGAGRLPLKLPPELGDQTA